MLPLNLVYGLETPDDKLNALNSLITECIDRHAPLRRVKVTRPPAPWMHSEEIRKLQLERNRLRMEVHSNSTSASWSTFRAVRNEIKSLINKTRKAFLSKALSSKRPKELWRVIQRVLKPSPQPLRADPNALNQHFASTAERTLGAQPDNTDSLFNLLDFLPTRDGTTFCLNRVSPNEIWKEIQGL